MILVLNAGSSTLKYKLFGSDAFAHPSDSTTVLLSGTVERIGEIASVPDHAHAIHQAIEHLRSYTSVDLNELTAIGHRVVHAGDSLKPVELVDQVNYDAVVQSLQDTIPLAPLHNPPAIACLQATFKLATKVPNVLVFDTGFFQQLPVEATRYAVPSWFLERYKIRRYGAHGTSHHYVSQQAIQLLKSKALPVSKLITLHLGNGASVAAIKDGMPIDTSMGLTPLEGLVMGTRCGDIDPAIVTFLQQYATLSYEEVNRILNKESGLKGLCGDSDMRQVEQRVQLGDADASLAFEVFCRRILKYVGAYTALLQGLDALVFTAGIGEHSAAVRRTVCLPLEHLGIELDEHANAMHAQWISQPSSKVAVLVMHTDEERAIYEQTRAVLSGYNAKHASP